MAGEKKNRTNPMPTIEQFRKHDVASGIGGYDYTDWNAYNDAVMRWRQQQEEGRYQEGHKLLQDVMGLFSGGGAADQAFNVAKNRFMSQSASEMVKRGMGNVVNAPSMNLAYEQQVRPEFELGKQSRLANAMSSLAQFIGGYNPSYEQMVQPRSPTTLTYGGGGGGGGGGFSPFSGATPTTAGQDYSYNNPVSTELSRLTQSSDQTTSPFANTRSGGQGGNWPQQTIIEMGDGKKYRWENDTLIPITDNKTSSGGGYTGYW